MRGCCDLNTEKIDLNLPFSTGTMIIVGTKIK